MKNPEKVSQSISVRANITYDAFENLVLHTLDKMAPIKQNHIRGKQPPFMNKDIRKATMTRTDRN